MKHSKLYRWIALARGLAPTVSPIIKLAMMIYTYTL